MDRFVLAIVLALAVLSFVPPDWEKDEKSSWLQAGAMAFGLVMLGVYIVARPWLL